MGGATLRSHDIDDLVNSHQSTVNFRAIIAMDWRFGRDFNRGFLWDDDKADLDVSAAIFGDNGGCFALVI